MKKQYGVSLVILILILGYFCFRHFDNKLNENNALLQAQVTKQQQEADFNLQTKCAEQADAFYKKRLGLATGEKLDASYSSHWNKEKSRCYALLTARVAYDSNGNKMHSMRYIYDVMDGTIQGAYGTALVTGIEQPVICKMMMYANESEKPSLTDCAPGLFDSYERDLMNK